MCYDYRLILYTSNMLTLLTEAHFWSTRDDLPIKDTDYGSFKYYDKKDDNSSDLQQSKKLYTEKRNHFWQLTNKRPSRLKDKLKEFEDQIAFNKIVYCKWLDCNILQIMLCTGLFINMFVNSVTGDVKKISFDKFLVGKLLPAGCISDVLKTRSHVMCTYNENRITLVHFTRKSSPGNNGCPPKLASLEPRVQVCELAGPSGRRLERKLSCNSTGDRLLVWWRASTDEVYPWSPTVKDQDRANVHIYSVYGSKMELQCFRRTEFDPLEVIFDAKHTNLVHCVEQKISRRGAVSVEVSSWEILRGKFQQQNVSSIPLQTHVCCHAMSADRLALGCIDGSVALFDRARGVTSLAKAAFIPTLASWHPSTALLLLANDRSQLQWFDLSLAALKTQTLADDLTPASLLDLSSYFRQQPTLVQMSWNNTAAPTLDDSLVLLVCERGPLCAVRVLDCGGAAFAADTLITQYVQWGQIERALATLLALDWNVSGGHCLSGLQRIVQHLFRGSFSPVVEAQIQRALGSFYAPLRPLSSAAKADFIDQVGDVTRRFFHTLVRHQLYEKAFCLAIDVGDHDLFMDLYQCAKGIDDSEMATAALARANELLERDNSELADGTCSRSSCSQCSEDDSISSDTDSHSLSKGTTQSRISENNTSSIDSWAATFNIIDPISNSESSCILTVPPLPTVPEAPANNFFLPTPPLPQLTTNCSNTKPRFAVTPGRPMPLATPPIAKFTGYNRLARPVTLQDRHISTTTTTDLLSTSNYFSSNVFSFPKLYSSQLTIPSPGITAQAHTVPPSVHIHKTVSLNIPPASSFITGSAPLLIQPPLKVNVPLNTSAPVSTMNPVRASGEKNVKFSDTVTAFIVPEVPRADKPKRPPTNPFLTNPKQELADSLPLCHPEDEYLKDFAPISNRVEENEVIVTPVSTPSTPTTKIKVVHFGMV